MKDKILKILHEDFDWAIKDTASFLDIGEPLSTQQPKNKYRLYVTHGTGEDYGTWVPNWINYDPTDSGRLDTLVKHIRIVNGMNQRNDGGVYHLVQKWVEGKADWLFDKNDTQQLKDTVGEGDYDEDGNWREVVEDDAYDWLRDELHDWGIMMYD